MAIILRTKRCEVKARLSSDLAPGWNDFSRMWTSRSSTLSQKKARDVLIETALAAHLILLPEQGGPHHERGQANRNVALNYRE